MPQLEWFDDMSVGVEEIDEQHRGLLDTINNLYDCIMEGTLSDLPPAREKALQQIEEYIATHFAAEEKYMISIGYPGFEEHRRRHEEFAAQIARYRRDLGAGELILTSDLIKTMLQWFRDHFLTEDRKYADFAAGKTA